MDVTNEEDRKIVLSPKVAQRIFSEQLKTVIESVSGTSESIINLHEVLMFHKKHHGYQIAPRALGFDDMLDCIKSLPYIEVHRRENIFDHIANWSNLIYLVLFVVFSLL